MYVQFTFDPLSFKYRHLPLLGATLWTLLRGQRVGVQVTYLHSVNDNVIYVFHIRSTSFINLLLSARPSKGFKTFFTTLTAR